MEDPAVVVGVVVALAVVGFVVVMVEQNVMEADPHKGVVEVV